MRRPRRPATRLAVRELEGSDTGIDPGLWTLLSQDIGLAAVGLPEDVGGLGGLAELLAVAEELGATLAPVPFVSSTVLCGQVLAGCDDAAAPVLERIAAGEIAAPAITEARGLWSAEARRVHERRLVGHGHRAVRALRCLCGPLRRRGPHR